MANDAQIPNLGRDVPEPVYGRSIERTGLRPDYAAKQEMLNALNISQQIGVCSSNVGKVPRP